MGLAHLQRRPAWGFGPHATEGSRWAGAEVAQARALVDRARSTRSTGEDEAAQVRAVGRGTWRGQHGQRRDEGLVSGRRPRTQKHGRPARGLGGASGKLGTPGSDAGRTHLDQIGSKTGRGGAEVLWTRTGIRDDFRR